LALIAQARGWISLLPLQLRCTYPQLSVALARYLSRSLPLMACIFAVISIPVMRWFVNGEISQG